MGCYGKLCYTFSLSINITANIGPEKNPVKTNYTSTKLGFSKIVSHLTMMTTLSNIQIKFWLADGYDGNLLNGPHDKVFYKTNNLQALQGRIVEEFNKSVYFKPYKVFKIFWIFDISFLISPLYFEKKLRNNVDTCSLKNIIVLNFSKTVYEILRDSIILLHLSLHKWYPNERKSFYCALVLNYVKSYTILTDSHNAKQNSIITYWP